MYGDYQALEPKGLADLAQTLRSLVSKDFIM